MPPVFEADACSPKNCAQMNSQCGMTPDGCGSYSYCGACPNGQQCVDNRCAVFQTAPNQSPRYGGYSLVEYGSATSSAKSNTGWYIAGGALAIVGLGVGAFFLFK